MILKDKKILCVFSHPDDEIIFGYPISQIGNCWLYVVSNNFEKRRENPIRALEEVCSISDIKLVQTPDIQSGFYRLPIRFVDYTLKDVISKIKTNIERAIDKIKPDYLFTHNPIGEYGHGDHRLLFNLITTYFDLPMLITDICQSIDCHLSSKAIPRIYKNTFYTKDNKIGEYVLDESWFSRRKAVYEKCGAWSWSGHPIVKSCNLYKI